MAVILDDTREMKADGEGKQTMTRVPRTQEELKKLFELVSTAVGVDETRGDQVTVQNVPFDEPVQTDLPAPPRAPASPRTRASHPPAPAPAKPTPPQQRDCGDDPICHMDGELDDIAAGHGKARPPGR